MIPEAENSGEAGGVSDTKWPPRLIGAQLPGSSTWSAHNDILPPPDYAAFEFISKQEHESICKDREERAAQRATAEISRMAHIEECQRQELADAEDRAAEWERIVLKWMSNYYRLKEKYDPMIAIPSSQPGGGMGEGKGE